MSDGIRCGVDAGSREVKLVFVDGESFVFNTSVDTIEFYRQCRNGGGELDITRLDKLKDAPKYSKILTTGYGRNNIDIKGGKAISEIMAHARGAVWQTGLEDFTLVDMGGQDTKVISVKGGVVDDFLMNDKCAAGSGRYLENIARVLNVSLDELSTHSEQAAPLSNTCAIFGESEVIGLISEGVEIEKILAGANRSVVMRLLPMIKKQKPKRLVVTGGVARNRAVVKLLGAEVGLEAIVPELPQLNGAIGCCYFIE